MEKFTIQDFEDDLKHGNESIGAWDLKKPNRKSLDRLEGLRQKQIKKLEELGVIATEDSRNRLGNVGGSNYAEHLIQPYSIWLEYELNPWDADIVKRVLRTKSGDPRALDYEKIIHVCQERLRQLKC